MRNNTDRMNKTGRKKIAPVVTAVIVLCYIGPFIGTAIAAIIGLAVSGESGVGWLLPFLLLYALAGGALTVGILLALAQRLREIDGGEEEDARKY